MSNLTFNQQQLSLLATSDLNVDPRQVEALFNQNTNELTTEQLLTVLEVANALYRAGFPVISDATYDTYIEHLRSLVPDHPYLSTVEPEIVVDSKTVPLPKKMLSTDKAYSFDVIKKWVDRLLKAAAEVVAVGGTSIA